MKTFQYYFTIFFCSLFVLVILAHFYIRGQKELDNSVKIKGLVVDKVPVWQRHTKRRTNKYVDMPQIEYTIGDTKYLFVDRTTSLEIGETPTLIYEKGNFRKIKVYNLGHWIDISFLIPALIIGGGIYCVVMILTTRYKKPEILPSNL